MKSSGAWVSLRTKPRLPGFEGLKLPLSFFKSVCLLGLPSLATQTVKNLPATQETQVLSLRQEDPLAEGMEIRSSQYSCLRIPWTEEPGRLQTMGLQSQIQPSE